MDCADFTMQMVSSILTVIIIELMNDLIIRIMKFIDIQKNNSLETFEILKTSKEGF